jgi:hypothetical protein
MFLDLKAARLMGASSAPAFIGMDHPAVSRTTPFQERP